jgi:urea carboxylase
MFRKVLIANRGAIACRVIRTLRRLGVGSVAVYSEADRHARHVFEADEAVAIGPAAPAESYLRQDRVIQAALATSADAVHPGYGFLSENAAFARACEAAGVTFIGPTPEQMLDFGLKHRARDLARANGVPLLPGSGLLDDVAHAHREAGRIGYPVMLKSTAGGGGIGMQLCGNEAELAEAFHSVERLARGHFSQGGIFLEKFVEVARHLEVQIFGDGRGRVVSLGERDCSMQRRNQKVLEETPAPGIPEALREALANAAVRLGRAVGYRSAGTVEFVYDVQTGAFYFLEVNTRLQVEHGVTEAVTGVDLVEWMVRTAAGEPPDLERYAHAPRGHSIQARVYAEDPGKGFQPSAGLLTEVRWPEGVRVETWVERGTEVSPHYDPMLAKVIALGETRAEALARLERALAESRVDGIETNLEYLRQVVRDPVFRDGTPYTRYLGRFAFRPRTVEVLQPGTLTTVQDWPGRLGYWDVGVPPSGPMDALAFRLANRVLGNPQGAPALEMTVSGPTLRFQAETRIALTGAVMDAALDGQPVPWWRPVRVARGSTLRLRGIRGPGARTYLAVLGGFDVPAYLGSAATFTLGGFGGHGGRALRAGDVLRLGPAEPGAEVPGEVPAALIPAYGDRWEIDCLYGPHGAPDFFTDRDVEAFFAADWEVHYHSSRTGVRLIGPRPEWARQDGGEAGLHPSNLHDCAYAVGTVDFTGDMPVILGPDGPSLGGFVCPATVVEADLWKVGQLRPGDRVRFRCVGAKEAVARARALDAAVERLAPAEGPAPERRVPGVSARAVLAEIPAEGERPAVVYRQAGDRYLLIEYGPPVLDLTLRFRVHALMQRLRADALPGVVDLTPGIRSLQVHYDSRRLGQAELLQRLAAAERALPAVDDLVVPSRTVHLPIAWDDPAIRLSVEKYAQSVRPDAPWCPSNIEFIRRINGLEDEAAVREVVLGATYLVMGLGDVYLGAPVATPLDPRHRLVTTKYNPARTWTPENAVGIGGAYLCVYGMEGPGGYQLFGRTVQMWNRFRSTADFREGIPWLLRFFDRLRFYPVTPEELLRLRDDFLHGRFRLEVEEGQLRLADYRRFLADNADGIAAFKARQQAAFEAERARWEASGQAHYEADPAGDAAAGDAAIDIPPGCLALASPVAGSVWQVLARPGERVAAGQGLVVVEAMKMEVPIEADQPGEVVEVLCAQGAGVSAGQALLILRPEQP